jgi:hypothetical protein
MSKDGTKIAFDRVGTVPSVILVNGAMVHRSSNPMMAQLAELLGKHFTVYNYDRRGRGESGDTKPFTKSRELEDIQVLVEDAGGAVTLEATASIFGITRAVVYEVPFIVDNGRQPLPDYAECTTRLAAEGKLNELVEYFLTDVVGIPAEYAAGTKQDQNMWNGMLAIGSHRSL